MISNSTPRRCQLCGLNDNGTLGPLAINDTIVVHVACMVYTTDVWVRCASGHAVFMPGPDGKMLFNKHYRPHTIGFGKAVSISQLCHTCNVPGATLRCSRDECKKTFHMPCAIASCRESFIFHAKMVHYEKEEVINGLIPGVLRPGRFLICRHHSDWEDNQIWSFLKSYILERPNLVNAISIDVDALPHDLQIAVSKASQMLIFSPVKNNHACKLKTSNMNLNESFHILSLESIAEDNRGKDDESIIFTDVEGNELKLPRKQWIKWDAAWAAQLKNAKLVTKVPEISSQKGLSSTEGEKPSPGAIISPTPAPTPVAPPSFSDSVIVPPDLSTFVTKSYFTAVLKKVREQSSVTSICLSGGGDASAVSILITAAARESATLARRLVEKQLEQGQAMMADRERNMNKLSSTADEIKQKSTVESREPLNILATVAMLHSASSSADTGKKNEGLETKVQKEVSSNLTGSGGSTNYGIARKKQIADKEEVVEIFCGTCAGLENKLMGKMLNCTVCNVFAHSKCVDGYGALSADGSWKCAACLDSRATQCCFCETKSNQLIRRPTYPNCFSWIHTVCLHAQNTGMLPEKKETSDSDSDSDDDCNVCTICADDDSKRVDLQRVKCAQKDCTNCFHMSCAWLAGYKLQRIENPQKVAASADLLMPIMYRLHAYCEEHSGGPLNLPKRERYDGAVISDIVSKESWRENNAYHKVKPITAPAHMPTQAGVLARNHNPTPVRSDSSKKESVVGKSRVASRGKHADNSGDSDDSGSGNYSGSDDSSRASRGLMKLKGKNPLLTVKKPMSAKDAIQFAKQIAAGKGTKASSKVPNKSRGASEALASTKKTMSYSAFLASNAATSAAVSRPFIAPSAPIQKRPMTSHESDSSAPTLSRLLPRKNPEKQAEFKAERLRKRQAEDEEKRFSDTAISNPPAHHTVEDIIMKERLRKVLEYQPDCYVMVQHFGSLIEQAFTFVTQLWGKNRSLAEWWKSSESLPELRWEYMLSEDDFRERGFNIVINDSTADTVQVFGLDPLIRNSAGTSSLKMIVDSSFAVFCGQVPVTKTKTDVIMIVHAEAASGKSIARQLTACNVDYESSYFLVAFSRNSLLTPQPAAATITPTIRTHVMPQVQALAPRPMLHTQQDMGQTYSRTLPVAPFHSYPYQPVEPAAYYQSGFHPQMTAQTLSAISAGNYFNDNQGASWNQYEDVERNANFQNENGYGMHQGKSDRSFVPPPPPQPPIPTARFDNAPDPQRPRGQAQPHKTPSKGYYGNDDGREQRLDRVEVRKDSNNEGQGRSDKRKDTYNEGQGRSDKRKDTYNEGQDRSDKRGDRDQVRKDTYNRDETRQPGQKTDREDRKSDPPSYSADKQQSGYDRKRGSSHLNDSDGARPREQTHPSNNAFRDQPGYPKPIAAAPKEPCPFFRRGFCKFGSGCKGSHSYPPEQKQVTDMMCEICGRRCHMTNDCRDKHPQRNHGYKINKIGWADSSYGKKWKKMGFDCTQANVNPLLYNNAASNTASAPPYNAKRSKW